MVSKSIIREIRKLDGVVLREKPDNVFGIINGYDVEFQGGVLTVRHNSKRKYYDVGSDYNPGGYIFINKLKHLGYYTKYNE